ncbi:NUDIX hydrolase [Enterococcus italicus]
MKFKKHFGVYGTCIKDRKLLCIQKNAGPYRGRYNLPGGSQEIGEGLTETLVREVLEETGYRVISYANPRVYDVFVKEETQLFTVHHLTALYTIELDSNQKQLPTVVSDGLNDSDAAVWVDFSRLTLENASPLVLKVKEEFLGQATMDKITYPNWRVIH